MRTRRLVTVLLSALALSGCWLQPRFGPTHQNYNPFEDALTPETIGTVAEAWSAPMPQGLSALGNQPLVTGKAVIVAGWVEVNGSFVISAYGRRSGDLLWRRELATVGPGALIWADDDEVITAHTENWADSQFTRLAASTGDTLATTTVPAIVQVATPYARSSVTVTDDVIVDRERAGSPPSTNFVARSRDSFDVLWTAPLSTNSGPTIVADGQIYVAESGETPEIAVFDADGCGASVCAPTSTISAPPPDRPVVSLGATPLAASDDGHLYLHRSWDDDQFEFGNDLVAVDTAGTPLWTVPLRSLDDMAVAGDKVFVTGQDPAYEPTMMAVDRVSGALLWRSDPTTTIGGSPIVAGGLVYAEGHGAAGTDVAVFAVDGCGAPTCPPLTILDTGPGGDGFYGMSAALGALFVHKAGPDGFTVYAPAS